MSCLPSDPLPLAACHSIPRQSKRLVVASPKPTSLLYHVLSPLRSIASCCISLSFWLSEEQPCTGQGSYQLPSKLNINVSVILRYGYYGDCPMVLGPSSSRLMKASSMFVEQVEVRGENRKGTLLYGFSEKPELSKEANWSASNYLVVGSYGRKGYSLWLNKGSRICIRWATQTIRLDKIEVIIIKGERKRETLLPKLTVSFDALFLNEPVIGKEAEYNIEEDDKYYVDVINSNPRSIIMTFGLNVTSKVYDVTKASNMCSTLNGSCRLKILFPDTRYVIVSTPDDGDSGWYIELSFVARFISYIAILGFFITIVLLVLKYLGACDSETTVVDTAAWEISWRTETNPILPEMPVRLTYGTTAEEDDNAETLYLVALLRIYMMQNYVIMEEENKMCPICRRLIHKVRRLFSP
ncbi:hypothetical protein CRYUN_Cryun35bG0036200 [Craigia yunnanensis]